mmetsp:Transcript_22963/g.42221  ORF Transcript_22963/g.42221 Transcript_22963/m.42221 type:complete len:306 (-) Transcript_22963:974-1891(-)
MSRWARGDVAGARVQAEVSPGIESVGSSAVRVIGIDARTRRRTETETGGPGHEAVGAPTKATPGGEVEGEKRRRWLKRTRRGETSRRNLRGFGTVTRGRAALPWGFGSWPPGNGRSAAAHRQALQQGCHPGRKRHRVHHLSHAVQPHRDQRMTSRRKSRLRPRQRQLLQLHRVLAACFLAKASFPQSTKSLQRAGKMLSLGNPVHVVLASRLPLQAKCRQASQHQPSRAEDGGRRDGARRLTRRQVNLQNLPLLPSQHLLSQHLLSQRRRLRLKTLLRLHLHQAQPLPKHRRRHKQLHLLLGHPQ